MRPYLSVRPSLGNSDYDSVCEAYGGGQDCLAAWQDLGDLLAYRPGWHFDLDVSRGEILWSLGLLGESRLNVRAGSGGEYICFDYASDTELHCSAILAIENWLSAREEETGQPSDRLRALARADNWNVFKHYCHPLHVTWSDGYYSASLPTLHDASFGSTLTEAVNAAAGMLCQLFGAPQTSRHS